MFSQRRVFCQLRPKGLSFRTADAVVPFPAFEEVSLLRRKQGSCVAYSTQRPHIKDCADDRLETGGRLLWMRPVVAAGNGPGARFVTLGVFMPFGGFREFVSLP